MKKILAVLLLIAFVAPIFAEDAKVLPQGVGRFYLVPGFAWASKTFDDDGDREDIGLGPGTVDSAKLANLAMALEYGILPWMSTGIKWIPGWVYYSDLDASANLGDPVATDVSDVEIGFKTQIVGPEAPVQSDRFRTTITPGLLVPTPGPDWEEEYKNQDQGDEYKALAAANHSWGFGVQATVDYVINDNFFISLFGEGRFYQAKEFKDVSLTSYGTYAMIAQTDSFTVPDDEPGLGGQTINDISITPPSEDVKLGADFNVELSPQFEKEVTNGVRLGASLPFDFRYTPGLSFKDDYNATADFGDANIGGAPLTGPPFNLTDAEVAQLAAAVEQNAEDGAEAALANSDEYTVTVTPGAKVFFTALPVPLEITLDWQVPLFGMNALVQNSVSSQIRVYFAF